MPDRSVVRGVVVVVLLSAFVSTSAAAPVATAPASASTSTDASRPPATGCFPPGGTEFVVGTEGPQISLVLHWSLAPAVLTAERPPEVTTDATDGPRSAGATTPVGALGIQAAATTGTARVLSLRSGVLFDGVADPVRFVTDPFAPFALAFDYRFTVPAFAGTGVDADYHASDVPVEGPVEEAACSD